MTEQKDLAQMCFEYRAKHRLTQEQMGRHCGVDRMIISKVEHGGKVSRMTETKIRMTVDGRK